MGLQCPTCSSSVTGQDVNLEAGVLVCQQCRKHVPMPALLSTLGGPCAPFEMGHPPAGASMRHYGDRIVISSRFSNPLVGALVLGIGLLCLGVSFFTFRKELNETHPEWFIPILMLGAGLFFVFPGILTTFGKVELTVGRDEGSLFKSVAGIGRRQRFQSASIYSVDGEWIEQQAGRGTNTWYRLTLDGAVSIKSQGRLWVKERFEFFLIAAKRLFVPARS